MSHSPTVWREPPEETVDYPGLLVHDAIQTGSIRIGGRLPLWTFIGTALLHDWDAVERHWPTVTNYDFDANRLASFLNHLLEQRGEFARLVCVLADVEREAEDRYRVDFAIETGWWRHPDLRARMAAQLRACLQMLEVDQ